MEVPDFYEKEAKETVDEVEILSQLNHPNIVKYIESFRGETSGLV